MKLNRNNFKSQKGTGYFAKRDIVILNWGRSKTTKYYVPNGKNCGNSRVIPLDELC